MTLGIPNRIFKISLLWIAYWLAVMGFISLVLKPMGIDYNKNYHLFSGLFLFFSLLGAILFKSTSKILVIIRERKFQLQLVTSTLIIYLLTFIVEELYPLSNLDFKSIYKMGILFPLFNIETFVSKLCDIFFQQTMICILILNFKENDLSKKTIIKFFTFIFFILHLPLFFIFKFYALLFILPSTVAGTIFSYLILSKKSGVFYSICIHQVFYLVLGILIRLNL